MLPGSARPPYPLHRTPERGTVRFGTMQSLHLHQAFMCRCLALP
uniref:Uncharacterized protein n=1 Tax=Siphoviridae sp. ctXOZ1 TaxID=2823585 RepID=A0A8S5LBE7_9CAUD|nr:MAG TPA: hypothetical protein [Siphoviridae sp. ctXOZ1]